MRRFRVSRRYRPGLAAGLLPLALAAAAAGGPGMARADIVEPGVDVPPPEPTAVAAPVLPDIPFVDPIRAAGGEDDQQRAYERAEERRQDQDDQPGRKRGDSK